MPGVWMTASAYVPDKPGKHPALLAVHGHWRGAQARIRSCKTYNAASAAKTSLISSCAVDAFGAGERA